MRPIARSLRRLYTFSVHNYNQSFPASSITRIHGRMLIDEHSQLKQQSLANLEELEKANYNKHRPKWEKNISSYWDITSQRKDTRTESPPELYDDYEYFHQSGVAKRKGVRDYHEEEGWH